MKIAVIATESMKQELLSKGADGDAGISWHAEYQGIEDADAVIDLLFQPGGDRISSIEKTGAATVIVNYVAGTLKNLPPHFVRINAWPGFLGGPVIEASSTDPGVRNDAEKLLALFNKKLSWVPDQPGFISARIVAMIINEAYLACGENVSTKEEIDQAMKLGTNYPYGPFEWAKLIGVTHVHELLVALSETHKRYQPAGLLAKEALS